MKFDIPLVKQERPFECGAVTLDMVLSYFGEVNTKRDYRNLLDQDDNGVIWTSDLAKTATRLGYKTSMYSKSLGVDERKYDLDFYQEHADELNEAEEKLESFHSEIEDNDGELNEETLTLDNIVDKTSKDNIPIIVLDWGIIDPKNYRQMHFVPVTGYDEDNIYVHEPHRHVEKHFPISRNKFNASRKSRGTDEDILFISK